VYDCGASRHISPLRERFVTYESIAPRPIMSSNSQVFHAIGQGNIYVDVPNGATSSRLGVLLRNALHAPDMAFTVVSLGRVMKAGYLVEFDDPSCNIKRKRDGIIIGRIPVSSFKKSSKRTGRQYPRIFSRCMCVRSVQLAGLCNAIMLWRVSCLEASLCPLLGHPGRLRVFTRVTEGSSTSWTPIIALVG